jgi:Est1 DNA/RNA binding domain
MITRDTLPHEYTIHVRTYSGPREIQLGRQVRCPFSAYLQVDADFFRLMIEVLPASECLGTRSDLGVSEYDSIGYDPSEGFVPYDNLNERDPSLLLQPETRPISQEQLVNEVKGIYAGLVMVEKKCVEIDNQQAQNQAEGRIIKLTDEQWQALIALHRTLLHEHHDFFLASQHPSASPALRKLAAKYAMPARLWRHGIHSFLELLRHRLPDSLDHMLAFIYLAYSMMALLKESVPAFEDTWIECLGDLARYRMAIEDEDLRDREVWSGVARYWYNKTADKLPRIGRIQHHLAVLARPNALQQLFYYTRALTCIQPFLNARESILTVFNPILEDSDAVIHRCVPIDIAFIKAHGILFKQGSLSTLDEHAEKFLFLLDHNIGRVTAKWREQGVWIASSNFFGLLSCVGFGTTDTLFMTLSRILTDNPSRSVELAKDIWISIGTDSSQLVIDNRQDIITQSPMVHTSHLTFSTLALALQRIGDRNVLPHVHISLAFLSCVSLVPEVMKFIESYVPWALLVAFLNTLGKPGVKYARVEADTFPLPEDRLGAYLPEDFAIRGQVWCQQYHPERFFGEDCPLDDEERSLEMPSMTPSRVERCIWLGIRLCSVRSFKNEDCPYH